MIFGAGLLSAATVLHPDENRYIVFADNNMPFAWNDVEISKMTLSFIAIAALAGVRYIEMPVMFIHQGFCYPSSDQEPLYL